MTQENRSPRDEFEKQIEAGLRRRRDYIDVGLHDDWSENVVSPVLDAIKEAGGVVLMPRDVGAKRAWGEITEIPGAYVNVLEADP